MLKFFDSVMVNDLDELKGWMTWYIYSEDTKITLVQRHRLLYKHCCRSLNSVTNFVLLFLTWLLSAHSKTIRNKKLQVIKYTVFKRFRKFLLSEEISRSWQAPTNYLKLFFFTIYFYKWMITELWKVRLQHI